MDHRDTEERDTAFLYLKGKLSADERTQFEEHFVDCPQCLDRIEITQHLRSGLKRVAEESMSQEQAPALAGWAGWLARLQAWQQAALLACVIVLLAVPASLLVSRIGFLSRELNRAKQISDEWQQRYSHEHQARADLQQQLQPEKLAGAAIFPLVTSRSADLTSPVNRIKVSRTAPWVVLSLERAYESDFQSYRVTLKASGDTASWQASDLVPSSPSALAVALPSSLLRGGNYLLTLEGLTRDGHYVVAASYPFQVSIRK